MRLSLLVVAAAAVGLADPAGVRAQEAAPHPGNPEVMVPREWGRTVGPGTGVGPLDFGRAPGAQDGPRPPVLLTFVASAAGSAIGLLAGGGATQSPWGAVSGATAGAALGGSLTLSRTGEPRSGRALGGAVLGAFLGVGSGLIALHLSDGESLAAWVTGFAVGQAFGTTAALHGVSVAPPSSVGQP